MSHETVTDLKVAVDELLEALNALDKALIAVDYDAMDVAQIRVEAARLKCAQCSAEIQRHDEFAQLNKLMG